MGSVLEAVNQARQELYVRRLNLAQNLHWARASLEGHRHFFCRPGYWCRQQEQRILRDSIKLLRLLKAEDAIQNGRLEEARGVVLEIVDEYLSLAARYLAKSETADAGGRIRRYALSMHEGFLKAVEEQKKPS